MSYLLLWSDALYYFLVGCILVLISRIAADRIARAQWQVLVSSPKNLIASCVLIAFSLIALADSIHFKLDNEHAKAGQVISLLDIGLSPISNQNETSYSAPFAFYSFSQEPQVLNNGKIIRDYPRLQYAGVGIPDNERSQHMISLLFQVVFKSILVSLGLIIVLTFFGSFMSGQSFEYFGTMAIKGKSVFAHRTFWGVIFVFTTVFIFIADFAPHYHILGTSKVGEDVFYQCLKSIRTGILIGTLTTLLMLPFALILGLMAGYFRGRVDDIIQYVYTTLSAIPGVLLIAAMVLSLQVFMSQHAHLFPSSLERADIRLLGLCAILGLTSWTGLCRLIRAECLKISQMDYVKAAKTLGTSEFKILFKHLLPNVGHIILISIALDFSGLVLAEAVLSYVGVGVDPTTYSWGTMINGARLEMAREPVVWWALTGAFIFMFILVLSANLFADGVRDATDPRLNKAIA